VIAGCAKNVRFEAGAYICRENDAADSFYLIRHGQTEWNRERRRARCRCGRRWRGR